MYTALEDVIRHAVFYDFEDNDGQQKHAHLQGQDVYYSAVRIGDKTYSVKIKLNIAAGTLESSYKDHRLEEIEVAPVASLAAPAEAVTSANVSPSGATAISIGDLTAGVKPQSVSKVVDENGEPLVVYHGSSKWFSCITFRKRKVV